MDRDFILYVTYKDPVRSRAYCCRTETNAFLQLDLLVEDDSSPRPQEAQGQREEREIIFVLDCSGSMGGDSIREAKGVLEVCLRAMTPGDWFNVYRFGSTWERIYDSLRPYSEESLKEVLNVVGRFDADMGGTEVLGPLRDIFASSPPAQGRRRDVILLTDGEVGNELEIVEVVRGNQGVTRFFPIGIGAGPNEYLIKALARAGRGAWEFVYPGERIELKVLRLFGRLRDTEVEALEVLWGGSNVTQAPSRPAVYLGGVATIFARCDGLPQKEAILVRGAVRGRKRTWEVPLIDVKSEDRLVPVLWARERIQELEEGGVGASRSGSRQLRRKTGQREEAVIQLSKTFGVLSGLTSFVALEERPEKERTTGEPVLRKVPVLVTAGWHGLGTPIGFRRTFAPMMDRALSVGEPAYALPAAPLTLQEPTERYAPRMQADATMTDRLDILLSILSHQKAEGGLEMDEELAVRLGFDMAEIRQIAEEMAVSTEADKLLLLVTAILLRVLETYFASKKDGEIWEGPVQKTKDWHRRACREANPKIRGERLMVWAGRFVGEKVRVHKDPVAVHPFHPAGGSLLPGYPGDGCQDINPDRRYSELHNVISAGEILDLESD
ncbi:MAG: VWA domain-containing protein [Thermodesulfobacteriota bacterium]